MVINFDVDSGAFLPTKGYHTDAGLDLRCMYDEVVPAHSFTSIGTGVHLHIGDGYAGLIVAKSGLNSRGLTATGLVDACYTGPIVVVVHNKGDDDYFFERGDKVAQIMVVPIPYVEFRYDPVLNEGERKDNGFGSTGQ